MPDVPAPLDRRQAQIPPAETPGLSGLLTLAVAVVVVAGLYLGRTVLIPITLAVLLSFLIAPIVNLLRRLYVPRVPSVLLAVVLSIGLMLAFGTLIATQVADLAQQVPRYATTIEQKVEAVQTFAFGRMTTIMRRLGRQLNNAGTPSQPGAQRAEAPAQPDAQKPIPVEVHQPEPTALQIAERIVAPVVDPLSTTAIVFIVSIFILLQREDLRDRLIRLFGSSDLHRTTVAMNDAARRLSRYFLTQLGINVAFGVIIGTGLFFIGIPSALLWGILAMLLRFVPYIGSPLSAIFPVVLAAATDPGWSKVVWTAALYLVVEPIMGQVVEPLLYGRSTGLSPFSVVVAAIFWTWLWGPIGLILSTPLTLCLVVLGRHVERLEFLDVLLGDRPALTPVEAFYQRLLAGDPDEALEQAELLLEERSLSSYYDEVALKGLELAAVDAARGVLSAAQIERIKEACFELVEDLDDQEDRDPDPSQKETGVAAPSRAEQDLPKQPAPSTNAPAEPDMPAAWRWEASVLCIAGRGPLDDASAEMLAQLLRKHGLGSRALPHAAVSRAGLASLDVSQVAMICLSYLELEGAVSHLRYLLRRVRRRAPGIPVLVGLWPDEAEILKDDRLRAAVGADYYASTMRDAVEACLEAAHGGAAAQTGLPLRERA
ncbi:MAG: AI-2E family transporter [Acetobacteraceae bacterium]|nr:AI-2E family transporter [Acetobacteraceae bacterium]